MTAKGAARTTWVAVVLYACFLITPQARAQVSQEKLSLQELANHLQTPEEIARYMWRHFAYETDQTNLGRDEYWQSPEELLSNQKGDCEDFAIFARELLKRNGRNSFLVNIYGDGSAHTICVFKEGGGYNAIDGTDVIRHRERSLSELLSYISPFWRRGEIVTPSFSSKRGNTLKQFDRELRAQRLLDLSV